jgi:nitrogen fixation NifU-like protein
MKSKPFNRDIMSKNFDEFVENLQKEIMKMEIKNYNEKIVTLCYNPQNWGKLLRNEITCFEECRGGPKNYFLGLYLNIENNIIRKISFLTDGCGVMIATGSQTTILIEGKTIEFAENLKAEDVDKALMGLPENEKHCLDLAILALKSAIEKYKTRILI